ncbi:hypothetical protein IC614_02325 [Allosphingosinicella flava]|uniref:Uncharacterized protein n=1 Tax=Allosphingosinicella flava TaxID=2771430 RepID=A0A7T2LME6_9SPHN|nr:hypothetical protein [Sphingosinicella flava]QPQ55466.1 hypothetical protein IC614_02325 [Sphingosinicella flava]
MTAQYYFDRAAEARRDADAASLANVRERCLRSEAAFLDMASRAERGAKMRARLEAEKSAALITEQEDRAFSPPV